LNLHGRGERLCKHRAGVRYLLGYRYQIRSWDSNEIGERSRLTFDAQGLPILAEAGAAEATAAAASA
jgi:hypothetical protein